MPTQSKLPSPGGRALVALVALLAIVVAGLGALRGQQLDQRTDRALELVRLAQERLYAGTGLFSDDPRILGALAVGLDPALLQRVVIDVSADGSCYRLTLLDPDRRAAIYTEERCEKGRAVPARAGGD